MGIAENARFGDRHRPNVRGFSGGARLLILLGGCMFFFVEC